MEKKNYLWLVIGLVVLALAAYLVFSISKPNEVNPGNGEDAGDAINTSVQGEPEPEPMVNTEGEVIAQEEIIKVGDGTFSPKTFTASQGMKTYMTFSATDDKPHTFGFVDADLSYIIVNFNKSEGDKSIVFPTPAPGSYTFYVDTQDNTGTLLVK